MKARTIRDSITHEPIGVLLTTDPSLWEEDCAESNWFQAVNWPPREPETPDEGSWAELFGYEA